MGTALRKPAPWIEPRFGVAVRTGFRHTDENTGRTVEIFLCPGKLARDDTPYQSHSFFAELEGESVKCPDCSKRHPVIDFLEAEKRGFIVTRETTGSDASDSIYATAPDMAKAIRQAARPKRATARG
jgi:hypothetical protein